MKLTCWSWPWGPTWIRLRRGVCYLEFGGDQVASVDITFFGDQRRGELIGPSAQLAADKARFGASRVKRWFGRDWTTTPG